MITTESLASLNDHQCFVLLPEPKIRIAKITVPLVSNVKDQHQGFISAEFNHNISADDSVPEDNDQKVNTDYIASNQQNGTIIKQSAVLIPEKIEEQIALYQEARNLNN